MANILSDNPHYSQWTGEQVDEALKVLQKNYDILLKLPTFDEELKAQNEKLRKILDELIPRIEGIITDENGNSRFIPITGGTLIGDRPQICSTSIGVTPSLAGEKSPIYFPEISGYSPGISGNCKENTISFGIFDSPMPSFGWYWGNELLAYVDKEGCLMGACWNDFAEFRQSAENQAGRVICENGDGTLTRSKKRLQSGACIVSDTFGFAVGKTEICQTPVAVAGRVLAYTDKPVTTFKPGDPVCAGKNGTVSKMTRREVKKYPDRLIGTVSEIPNYEVWGKHNTIVNGRIWIKLK